MCRHHIVWSKCIVHVVSVVSVTNSCIVSQKTGEIWRTNNITLTLQLSAAHVANLSSLPTRRMWWSVRLNDWVSEVHIFHLGIDIHGIYSKILKDVYTLRLIYVLKYIHESHEVPISSNETTWLACLELKQRKQNHSFGIESEISYILELVVNMYLDYSSSNVWMFYQMQPERNWNVSPCHCPIPKIATVICTLSNISVKLWYVNKTWNVIEQTM